MPARHRAAGACTTGETEGTGLAITAPVLGVITLLTSWVPFIGIIGIIVEFVGVLFGLLGGAPARS